jgi:hypothetical protein
LKRPVIMLPQTILFVPALLSALLSAPALAGLAVVLGLISFVLGIMVSGAYPSMVKAIVDGGQFSIIDALGRAYHRFWSLLGAAILVVIIVALGLIALIVPGIIFITWYAYTTPAIMLEGKGALEGMAASKAFGRDKKWSTFLLLVVFACVGFVILLIQSALSLASPVLGQIASAILEIPVATWAAVAISYTYLTFGPSSVQPAPGVPGFSSAPLASAPPPVQPVASTSIPSSSHFCAFCGSPLRPDSRFCPNCGKPV